MCREIGTLHLFFKKNLQLYYTFVVWDAMKQIDNGRAGVGKTEYLLNCKENAEFWIYLWLENPCFDFNFPLWT